MGKVVGLFIERHPAFATNPLGDWQELVGESMARYCQPQSLKKKVLTVTAHDSVWKYHLELLKDSLLEKINQGTSRTPGGKDCGTRGRVVEQPRHPSIPLSSIRINPDRPRLSG